MYSVKRSVRDDQRVSSRKNDDQGKKTNGYHHVRMMIKVRKRGHKNN